jgi:hypothetical protein
LGDIADLAQIPPGQLDRNLVGRARLPHKLMVVVEFQPARVFRMIPRQTVESNCRRRLRRKNTNTNYPQDHCCNHLVSHCLRPPQEKQYIQAFTFMPAEPGTLTSFTIEYQIYFGKARAARIPQDEADGLAIVH